MSEDRELCALLLRQPEKGLEKIMDRYMGFVAAIARGKLPPADAETHAITLYGKAGFCAEQFAADYNAVGSIEKITCQVLPDR